MKKEIKFRAFYKSQIIYNIELAVSKGIHYYFNGKDILIDVPLMQFTGLKDRHGKEIYEGDILRHGNIVVEVKFKNTLSGSSVYYGYPDEHNYPCNSWLEIIGNVYEHPGLLNN